MVPNLIRKLKVGLGSIAVIVIHSEKIKAVTVAILYSQWQATQNYKFSIANPQIYSPRENYSRFLNSKIPSVCLTLRNQCARNYVMQPSDSPHSD